MNVWRLSAGSHSVRQSPHFHTTPPQLFYRWDLFIWLANNCVAVSFSRNSLSVASFYRNQLQALLPFNLAHVQIFTFFFSFFIRSLESSLKDSKPVAIQLRMLEEFTSHQSFNNPGDPVGNRKDAAMVTVYLARNGKSSESLLYIMILLYY